MKKLILLLAASVALQAAPFAMFNTGVDPTSVVLAGGSTDPHYVGVSPTSTVFVLGLATALPGAWVPNDSVSKWVGPDQTDGGSSNGLYSLIYRTTVDLTGFNASTAVITGRWTADNFGTDILLNGVSTGQTSTTPAAFSSFALNSGFVSGINTIDFLWTNAGFQGGVRVEVTSAQADLASGAVPEPASMALMFGGLAALAYFRRR